MFDRKIYTEGWRKVLRWLTPFKLRQVGQNVWISVFCAPIVYVYDLFTKFKVDTAYRLSITPQVCYLEKSLNDRYDVALRRIYIGEPESKDSIPLFQAIENKPFKLYKRSENKPIILYTKMETQGGGADFIINIPSDIGYDINELTAFVNQYKLVTKQFTINRF